MMSCVESYTIIKEALKDKPSDKVKEAFWSLDRFTEVFCRIDATLNDPVMIDICLNLAELHFNAESPLRKKPIETIQNEYRKRTGKMISTNICTAAYYNAVYHYADRPETVVSKGGEQK